MEKKKLFRKWAAAYIAAILVATMLMLLLGYIAYVICNARVWHVQDRWYVPLKWIKTHLTEVIPVLIAVISIVCALVLLYRIAQGIRRLQSMVEHLYTEKEELPHAEGMFQNLENQILLLQEKNLRNERAAQEANQRKNDMLMYMAHDLKTPLTSVIGYLSLVCNEPEIPEQIKQKYAGIALEKSFRLEDLINEFFDITRFNFSHMILEKSNVNLTMMLSQVVSEFEPQLRQKGLQTALSLEDRIELVCDADKMERVFDNLLRNIVSYSYPNTVVDIKIQRKQPDCVQIVTCNRGKTIPQEMVEHIFEQFFRMDSSRNSDTGGSGLGLAAAKEIVTLHGGTIACTSREEQIWFTIELPLGEGG